MYVCVYILRHWDTWVYVVRRSGMNGEWTIVGWSKTPIRWWHFDYIETERGQDLKTSEGKKKPSLRYFQLLTPRNEFSFATASSSQWIHSNRNEAPQEWHHSPPIGARESKLCRKRRLPHGRTKRLMNYCARLFGNLLQPCAAAAAFFFWKRKYREIKSHVFHDRYPIAILHCIN